MRQQAFEFIVETTAPAPIPLAPGIVADVIELMAAAILAACREGAEESDDPSSSERQDHD